MRYASTNRKLGIWLAAGLAVAGGTCGCAPAAQETPTPSRAELERFVALVDEYFDGYYRFRPHEATAIGLHQHDSRLGSFTQPEFEREITRAQDVLRRLNAIDRSRLDADRRLDAQILEKEIKKHLFRLEQWRRWENDPRYYNEIVNNGISSLVGHELEDRLIRLRNVIAREGQIPAAFQAARENLKNPPKLYTELAISEIEGAIEFFSQAVPKAFSQASDPALAEEFRKSNQLALDTLRAHLAFLKRDLLPRSAGRFDLGKERYSELLLLSEAVDTPAEELLRIGKAELERLQAQFLYTAQQIDPRKSPEGVLRAVQLDHPRVEELVSVIEGQIEEIRKFAVARDIITIPSEVRPRVAMLPGFYRPTASIGSMETPGVYEARAGEAFFRLAPPPPPNLRQDVEEYLQFFNRATLPVVAMLETYPGRYLHYLWLKSNPSKVRKLVRAELTWDGWPHYAEQVLLDEGYRSAEPKIRLAQLQLARLRAVRFLTSLQMHVEGMSFDEAVAMFRRDAAQSPAAAVREARRSATDPLALSWTLGRLEILALREDYRRQKGSGFSLRQFHDDFLRQGMIPIRLIRTLLLGEGDKPKTN